MTVTLYVKWNIHPELIISGVRTWIGVKSILVVKKYWEANFKSLKTGSLRSVSAKTKADLVISVTDELHQLMSENDIINISMGANVSTEYVYEMTFANEADAMAFRLRYDQFIIDKPQCDGEAELMALEAR